MRGRGQVLVGHCYCKILPLLICSPTLTVNAFQSASSMLRQRHAPLSLPSNLTVGCSMTSAQHIKFCKGRCSAQWYGSQEQVLLGDGIVCSLKHWVRIDGARDKARAMVSRVGGWLY
ncbi:uncharacterized protein ARMOST_03415 [Armillaria ostoyae]|uniref:Uncharacterized protein n=1 Tax=Armillaria ostoyae TaxID=47428 RepID=A0A284QUK4_ARMOS|nr:uncharacterized protein ARMOST_03415 [Armillaria ostoyae]